MHHSKIDRRMTELGPKPVLYDGACISRQSQPETSNQMSQILS